MTEYRMLESGDIQGAVRISKVQLGMDYLDEGDFEDAMSDPGQFCIVAEEDGRVMGYAYAGPFVGRAAYAWSCEMSIYLDHTSRNRGLGRALYEAMEARLAAMGILNLYACIGATEHEDEYLTNNSAGFHAHMGYTLAGTFRKCGYKFGRWYDMIWMEKIIGEHLGEQPPVRFGNR